jgi:beta-galactosidase
MLFYLRAKHQPLAAKLLSLLVGTILLLGAATLRSNAASKSEPDSTPRKIESFNGGWKFIKGDPTGAEDVGFDDASWQPLRLPHDWAIAGPFNPNEDGHAAKLPWKGVGWYRKSFALDAADAGRRVYLDFDGVMAFPKVYVNGHLAGEWDYGYTSFRVDATPYVKVGEPNEVAVRVDTTKHGTRWYPGAGIYRKVTLTMCDSVHLAHWGTYITTPSITDEAATVLLRLTVDNHRDADAEVTVDVSILGPDGKQVTSGTASGVVPAGGSRDLATSLQILNPLRWDVDSPKLYTAMTTVRAGGQAVDQESTRFGVRTIEFTADDGFHLNGRRVQLQGVCLHHDQGPLGSAFYPRAMERQLEIMRDMGVNAIRTSHNPPAPELLELCDRMGFVVWDECFDKWNETIDRIAGQPPLEEYGEKHLKSLVMRDRNHPSVVVWSIGNEINNQPEEKEGLSPERVKFMSGFVRKYDATRPVGMAINNGGTAYTHILDALDVTGWNYGRRYTAARERYPKVPILYSESASALSTRGFYELPLPASRNDYSPQLQVDSYDFNSARWSDIPDVEFDLMERDKYVAGEFVWTGFDYLGEPTPFDRQACSSYFGIVDLCGIPKDRFYLYRSHWRPEEATVHILPHWNWPDRVGQNVPVFVYTNGDSAELFLNGKSLGRREKVSEFSPPENIAKGKPTTASSEGAREGKNLTASNAADGNDGTRWSAASDSKNEWWQVDLGSVQPIADVVAKLERWPAFYKYRINVSDDGVTWRTVAAIDKWYEGWGEQLIHGLNTSGRFVRVEFTDLRDGARASLRELAVYPQSYYAIVDKYRLRWMDVTYEPGELKAVAYQGDKKIGEAVMRTAGPPTSLRLTPDRTKLAASGEDLSYLLVEAVDADGNECPLADNLVQFKVDGPADIAGVGNGNPMSLEPNQADHRKLFFGKALVIVRTTEGEGGTVRITATSDGLKSAEASLASRP